MPGKPSGEPDLERLADEDGRMERYLPADSLHVPWLIELRSDGLFYAYHSPDAFSRPLPRLSPTDLRDQPRMRELGLSLSKAPSPRILDQFLLLKEANGETIFSFARRWGVLDLCKHGLPYTHDLEKRKWGIPRRWTCGPTRIPDPRFGAFSHCGFETLEEWRAWARRADAILKIAANLHANRRGRQRDWDVVANWHGEGLPRPMKDDGIDAEWYKLCDYVNEWGQLSQVSPHVSYEVSGLPEVRFGSGWAPGRLFGVIGLQLIARVSGARSMAVCSSCGCLFPPRRIPKPLEASYCTTCRARGAPVKAAKRRLASLKLKARSMRSQGVGVPEIARSIERRVSVVRLWTKGVRRLPERRASPPAKQP